MEDIARAKSTGKTVQHYYSQGNAKSNHSEMSSHTTREATFKNILLNHNTIKMRKILTPSRGKAAPRKTV